MDKAEKIIEKGLTAEEHKLGDILKEYTDRFRDSYQNAMNAKKSVTSIVGTIARSKFDEANRLIESFN